MKNVTTLCTLPFALLRTANVKRLPLFKNRHGAPAHNVTDGSDWSYAQWLQATAGEAGEYANVRKKLDRGDYTPEEFIELAKAELADVFIYTDLFSFRYGIALESVCAFSNFGKMQELCYAMMPRHFDTGESSASLLAESFLIMHEALSTLNKVAVTNKTNPHGKVEVMMPLLGFIERIFVLAIMLEIDLGEAVQRKFNVTSDKVKTNIYLVQRPMDDGDGSLVWLIDSVPF